MKLNIQIEVISRKCNIRLVDEFAKYLELLLIKQERIFIISKKR